MQRGCVLAPFGRSLKLSAHPNITSGAMLRTTVRPLGEFFACTIYSATYRTLRRALKLLLRRLNIFSVLSAGARAGLQQPRALFNRCNAPARVYTPHTLGFPAVQKPMHHQEIAVASIFPDHHHHHHRRPRLLMAAPVAARKRADTTEEDNSTKRSSYENIFVSFLMVLLVSDIYNASDSEI